MSPREHLQPYIAFAAVELGWDEKRFMSQTPLEWYAIMEAWMDRERRVDRRFARVCMVIANVYGNNLTEDDFMPKTQEEIEQGQDFDEMIMALSSVAPKANHG